MALGAFWMLLYAFFGWGVWRYAEQNRSLRIAGAAIFIAAIFGIFWPPMHLREVLAAGGGTLTDTLHLVWTAVNGVLTLIAIGAAATLDRGFRAYSIATIAIMLIAGVLTSMNAPSLDAGLPTPWIGAWERINMVAWLLWVAVLSGLTLRRQVPVELPVDVHVARELLLRER